MRVSIKQTTRTGKPATAASPKQIKYAEDIANRINAALDEISALGFAAYADEAGAILDQRTTMVDSGPRDVISYLSSVDRFAVFNECYGLARRDQNSVAVNALNPRNLK